MIFIPLLFVAVGVLLIYGSIWGMTSNTPGERLLFAVLGVIAFVLAAVNVFLELLVIRKFPKYQKLRRVLFNSDCYFTDSSSNEYFGGSGTARGRRYKAAFDLITSVAEVEKRMGEKKPIRYTVYGVLAILFELLGLVDLVAIPILYDNGTIFPNMSDNVFAFCYLSCAAICIAFAIFFLFSAIKIGVMAPLKDIEWEFALYDSLTRIAVRKNNKKRKFWYRHEQLKEIEDLVSVANKNVELKLIQKRSKPVSFTIVDTLNDHVVFEGFFK